MAVWSLRVKPEKKLAAPVAAGSLLPGGCSWEVMGSAGGAGRGGGLRRLGGGAGKGNKLQGCRVRAWGAAPGGRDEPPGAVAGPG
jgi:hypothetical protein